LLKEGVIDEVILFQSVNMLGKNGKNFFDGNALSKFKKTNEEKIGDDLKITLNPI